MGPAGGVVEVVGSDDFVLDALVVVLQALLRVVALEHVEVLHLEVLLLRVPDLEALRRSPVDLLLHFGRVQQVEHLLVVDLQKRAGNRDVFCLRCLFSLFECVKNRPN